MNFPRFKAGATLVAAALFLGAPAQSAILSVPSAERVDVLVHLPLRDPAGLDRLIALQADPASPIFRHYLTPAQFRAAYGPSPEAMRAAAGAIVRNGMTIDRADSQVLVAHAAAATIARTFGTTLEIGRGRIASRARASRALTLPPELRTLGATVAGLRGALAVRPASHRIPAGPNVQGETHSVGPYWFDSLKQAYAFPSVQFANGRGVTIATVGLADSSDDDAHLLFATEGFGSHRLAPMPVIRHEIFPGGAPFDPGSIYSQDANLDVQQAAGAAPGATVLSVTVGGTGEPFMNAFSALVDANRADIVDTSYTGCELFYTPPWNNGIDHTSSLFAYHDIFRQGNAQGIAFVVASGDDSGLGCAPPGYLTNLGQGGLYAPLPGAGIWVDDPNVTGVGGTNLWTNARTDGTHATYRSENAIADRYLGPVDPYQTGNYVTNALFGSGGGESTLFARPAFQKALPTGYAMRVAPDVAMHMGGCPAYGLAPQSCGNSRDSANVVAIAGAVIPISGTSAAAAQFAGVLALKQQLTGARLGNENYDLYRLARNNATSRTLRQGIYGYNGVVRVAPGRTGYNDITGVGTPIVRAFVGAPAAPLAGEPRTLDNP